MNRELNRNRRFQIVNHNYLIKLRLKVNIFETIELASRFESSILNHDRM